jgi:large subunit ribosomal protein L17
MRHRVAKRHFNRDTKHRKAMIMNLVRSLVEHGEIKTTTEKATEVRRWADKVISKAKIGDVAARRSLHRFFGKRDVVNTLVDRIAPLFPDRNSGFTIKEVLGKRRGDNTEMTKISFVSQPEVVGTLKTSKDGAAVKATPAKKKSASSAVKAAKKAPKKADASVKKADTSVKKAETSVKNTASKNTAPKNAAKNAASKNAAPKSIAPSKSTASKVKKDTKTKIATSK